MKLDSAGHQKEVQVSNKIEKDSSRLDRFIGNSEMTDMILTCTESSC